MTCDVLAAPHPVGRALRIEPAAATESLEERSRRKASEKGFALGSAATAPRTRVPLVRSPLAGTHLNGYGSATNPERRLNRPPSRILLGAPFLAAIAWRRKGLRSPKERGAKAPRYHPPD